MKKLAIILSAGLPSMGTKARIRVRPAGTRIMGIFTKMAIGKSQMMSAKTPAAIRYPNCFMVIEPINLNLKPVTSCGIG